MKKNTTKKPPSKKHTTKKSTFKIFALSNILVLITTVALIVIGYLYVANENNIIKNHKKDKIAEERLNQIAKDAKIEENERDKYFEEKTKALEIEYVSNVDNQTYVDNKQKDNKEQFNYDDRFQLKEEKKEDIIKKEIVIKEVIVEKIKEIKEEKEKKELIITKEKVYKKVDTSLPKLAIIIDDVTTTTQMKRIKDIGYTVNIAFLPPTSRHPSSAKIAKKLDTYMIHLPLEAGNHKYEEDETLYIGHDINIIDNKIRELRDLYPKATFINNHTGSKYTSNKDAMDKLLKVLKKYNYTFIDSKTTSNSVVLESAKKYGIRVLTRNIFLDNKKDKKYIQRQLKRAITIAKKNGSAIAIGHPYGITFSTLKQSKHLLKDVNLVFVQSL